MKKYLLVIPASVLLTGAVYFFGPGNNNSGKSKPAVKNAEVTNECDKTG